jgi:exosortase
MRFIDLVWLAALLAAAAWIWLRDRSWLSGVDEVLPLLAAPLLFLWLGEPWRGWRRADAAPAFRGLAASALMLVLGLALNVTLLLAAAWTCLLWTWLRDQVSVAAAQELRHLLVLPLLAFPWLTLDFPLLGWWFRLSAAWSAEHFFQLIGLAVSREGTQMIVQSFPVEVSAACAGLKVLQASLVAGSVLAFMLLPRSRWYWAGVAVLPVMAWLANTLRVVLLTTVALTFGANAATGWFHEFGGWLVLVTMFTLCALVFVGLRRLEKIGAVK